ncbi:MAG: hypothetical protein N2444_00370 [Methylocystis sp.]|nr:hypothetical protein [Methylocystis sp.]
MKSRKLFGAIVAASIASAAYAADQITTPGGSTYTVTPIDATRVPLVAAQIMTGGGGLVQSAASAPISVSSAGTVQIVAATSGQKIYVTSWDVVAGGTGTIKFVSGTGVNCGTGTADLTGAYSLVAQAGVAKGAGIGPVLIAPAGAALCVTTSAAVQMSGSVSYAKF